MPDDSTAASILHVSADEGRAERSAAFRQAGFAVSETGSGAEALRIVAERQPDIVLLDLDLPDMSGFEVCCRLRSSAGSASMPVLHLVSDAAEWQPPEGCTHAYLPKGALPGEMPAAARSLIVTAGAEQVLHDYLEAAPDAVVIIDERGTIVQLNAQTEKLFGYPRQELVGLSVEMLVPEPSRSVHVEYRRAFLARPQPRPMRSASGLVGLRKDGREVPIDVSLSPLPTQLGVFVAAAVRDVSVQRSLEGELRERSDQLEQADRRKDEFMAVLAHELRGPLNALAQVAALQREGEADAEEQAWANRVVWRQTAHMQRLVEDLLDYSRVRHGRVSLEQKTLDLRDVVNDALEIARPLVARHDLRMTFPPEPVRIRGDADRLVQVVANLLGNAGRYSPQPGPIWLHVAVEGEEAVLRVRDRGVGIARDMLDQVFELFVRAEPERSARSGGLGIGLALVRQLVELHGGVVRAISDGPGEGSEFVVRLPVLP